MPEYAFTNQPEVPAARRTNEDTNKMHVPSDIQLSDGGS